VFQVNELQPDSGLGHVFFWYDNWRLAARVRSRMLAAGFVEYPLGDERVHCFICDDFETCLPVLSNILTEKEKQQVSMLTADSARPELFDFGRLKSIAAHETRLLGMWLGDMLMDRRYRSLMQPIVSAKNRGNVLGYEFLMRGLHTDGTDIPAPNLFATAEKCQMSYALDMAAGESATRTAKLHNIHADAFVNVLPHTIGDAAGFDAWLQAVMFASHIDPSQIVFELVESQQLATVGDLKSVVDKLHAHGVRVAMDDFGSGFNNLIGLVEVSPDFIKLDKSLIQDIKKDQKKWNLIANIVDSAKDSEIEVIAEGVEDIYTADILTRLGVDYLQGYYIGFPADKPVRQTLMAV